MTNKIRTNEYGQPMTSVVKPAVGMPQRRRGQIKVGRYNGKRGTAYVEKTWATHPVTKIRQPRSRKSTSTRKAKAPQPTVAELKARPRVRQPISDQLAKDYAYDLNKFEPGAMDLHAAAMARYGKDINDDGIDAIVKYASLKRVTITEDTGLTQTSI